MRTSGMEGGRGRTLGRGKGVIGKGMRKEKGKRRRREKERGKEGEEEVWCLAYPPSPLLPLQEEWLPFDVFVLFVCLFSCLDYFILSLGGWWGE